MSPAIPKLEIDFVTRAQARDHDCYALVSMATGYGIDELYERLPARLQHGGWYGRDFREVFRSLGFDCSPRFVAFDPATPHACLLRYRPTPAEVSRRRAAGAPRPDFWDCELYYDGLVYAPNLEQPFPLADFNPVYRITSMLPVWLSNL